MELEQLRALPVRPPVRMSATEVRRREADADEAMTACIIAATEELLPDAMQSLFRLAEELDREDEIMSAVRAVARGS
jgi:hypothetical protein